MLCHKDFFSTESFLFEETIRVWDALNKIPLFLQKQKLGKIEGMVSDGAILENKELIFIGKGSIIEPGVYIKGPAFIGENCEIRQGAYLRGNVILEKEVIIGHCSEIKNSIFLSGAKAAHFNYVGDSILGVNTNLGAGVICSNYRLDQKEIYVNFKNQKILTGRKKFGLILGDHS